MGVDLRDIERRWQEMWRENPLPSPVKTDDEERVRELAEESASDPSESQPESSTAESEVTDDSVEGPPTSPDTAAASDGDSSFGDGLHTEDGAEFSTTVESDETAEKSPVEESPKVASEADSEGEPPRRRRRRGPRTFFSLDMFPYPSLDGFSVSQLRGVATNDVVARYQQSRGKRVLRPIGWDSFQASVEEEARQKEISPRQVVDQGVELMREQLRRFGALVHWDHEVDTSDPEDYRWSQWLFLQLREKGLVHQDDAGWKVAITDYAEPLHSGLKNLKWPPRTKALQRNWIGRREGTKLVLKASSELYDGWEELDVFARKIEALPEASFVVLCPEHPLLEKIVDPILEDDVRDLQERVAQLDERERMANRAESDGVATGAYALNPATLEPIPIWVSSYVMPDIRFGAILGMPEENEAHKEFANRHGIPLTGAGANSGRRRRRPPRRRQGGENSD
ncbi:MAG: class I tRNA ligase family protein, partial [Planctomycetota bacterium]